MLKAPKMVSCSHSFAVGQRCREVRMVKMSRSDPAKRNLTVKSVRGSDDCNPNFPATDAEAQRMEKLRPVMMKREECDKQPG